MGGAISLWLLPSIAISPDSSNGRSMNVLHNRKGDPCFPDLSSCRLLGVPDQRVILRREGFVKQVGRGNRGIL